MVCINVWPIMLTLIGNLLLNQIKSSLLDTGCVGCLAPNKEVPENTELVVTLAYRDFSSPRSGPMGFRLFSPPSPKARNMDWGCHRATKMTCHALSPRGRGGVTRTSLFPRLLPQGCRKGSWRGRLASADEVVSGPCSVSVGRFHLRKEIWCLISSLLDSGHV